MKWAKLDGIEPKNHLLYMMLIWVVAPHENRPVDHHLKRVFGPEAGFGGDPGWEIDRVVDMKNQEFFRVWADSDISGLVEDEQTYDRTTFLTLSKIFYWRTQRNILIELWR